MSSITSEIGRAILRTQNKLCLYAVFTLRVLTDAEPVAEGLNSALMGAACTGIEVCTATSR
jgi:hypothetical protein